MREKHINLQMIMPVAGFALLGIAGIFFLHQVLGSFTTILGSIAGLGGIGFIGWLIIEHTH